MNANTLITAAGDQGEPWRMVLVAALGLSAVLVLGYRIWRLTKGGPMADAMGGAVLAGMVAVIAVLVGANVGWARWPALAYGLLFGVVVMPIWTLAVLIPLPPGRPDYVFTALYWASLLAVVVAAIVL
jgi:hypothetical protein